MFTNLKLEKPIVVIDVETTGTNPEHDKIVEISVLKLLPDGQKAHKTRRVNPGIPIPTEVTLNLRAIIDAMEIFHHYERRDLAAAVRLYLNRKHADGHSAKVHHPTRFITRLTSSLSLSA